MTLIAKDLIQEIIYQLKRWFKIIFGTSEWTSVIKAMNFLKEIEAYEKE